MSLKKIEVLSLNPHFFKHLMQCFLTGYNKPCDLRLIFMVLPILLYEPSRTKLASAVSTSRLESIFNTPIKIDDSSKLSGKTRLTGFGARYETLQPITKQTLIILHSDQAISITGRYIIANKSTSYKDFSKATSPWMRAAHYLGVVFAKTAEDHIVYFLGVD